MGFSGAIRPRRRQAGELVVPRQGNWLRVSPSPRHSEALNQKVADNEEGGGRKEGMPENGLPVLPPEFAKEAEDGEGGAA